MFSTRGVAQAKVLREISQDDIALIATDWALLTGCSMPSFVMTEDGVVVISCPHGHHPIIEVTKRMAS
jgi:hypothetical protein